MSRTIGSIHSARTWKRNLARHAVSLGAGALAVSALVGFGGTLQSHPRNGTSRTQAEPAIAGQFQRYASQQVVYLVSTPERAAQMAQEEASVVMDLGVFGLRTPQPGAFFVKGSETELVLAGIVDAVAPYGVSVRVIDLSSE